MGRGAPDRITGWRTRATRPPPTVQPSRVRLHPVSVARSSAARMSSSPVGKPEIGGTPTPHGVEFVRYRRSHGLGFRRTAPKTPRMAVSAVFRASGGTGLGCLPPVGQRPIHGRNPLTRAGQGQAPGGPSRITSAGSSGQDGATLGPSPPRRVSRGGAPPRPPLPWRAGNAGVRGGRAPRQPPQGTHGVWPHGVRWLVSQTTTRQTQETGLSETHRRAADARTGPRADTQPPPCSGSHARASPPSTSASIQPTTREPTETGREEPIHRNRPPGTFQRERWTAVSASLATARHIALRVHPQ